MATKCRILTRTLKGAKVSYIIFSGTVKVDGIVAIRKIYGYQVGFPDDPSETVSDVSGNWEISMRGGTNDMFRFICVGNDGENSEIYENIME